MKTRTYDRIELYAALSGIVGIFVSLLTIGLFIESQRILDAIKINKWTIIASVGVGLVALMTVILTILRGRSAYRNQTHIAKEVIENKPEYFKSFLDRILRYFSLFIYLLVVYGGLLIVDYLLMGLVQVLLKDELQSNQFVASLLDYTQKGLIIFILIGVCVHGLLSMIQLVKIDLGLSREILVDEERKENRLKINKR